MPLAPQSIIQATLSFPLATMHYAWCKQMIATTIVLQQQAIATVNGFQAECWLGTGNLFLSHEE